MTPLQPPSPSLSAKVSQTEVEAQPAVKCAEPLGDSLLSLYPALFPTTFALETPAATDQGKFLLHHAHARLTNNETLRYLVSTEVHAVAPMLTRQKLVSGSLI